MYQKMSLLEKAVVLINMKAQLGALAIIKL